MKEAVEYLGMKEMYAEIGGQLCFTLTKTQGLIAKLTSMITHPKYRAKLGNDPGNPSAETLRQILVDEFGEDPDSYEGLEASSTPTVATSAPDQAVEPATSEEGELVADAYADLQLE